MALNSELTLNNAYQGEELAKFTISSPKRFISFLIEIENEAFKRVTIPK
ncbi:hypothetical protein THF1C08_20130 [Vibrio jasicida]|uniref:Uncharacterized protein n=1 Tax=Vibrio jasicida TaxID=766224 RepID=A0AAU9QK92_9VIBR|nr:hypothetical protein THF1C08_20130 [Vibrio jasicida]CAH1584951.1 hypothetical protein THF1A12_20131 [Vibrio jasicida]